jgi:hypothetical protein
MVLNTSIHGTVVYHDERNFFFLFLPTARSAVGLGITLWHITPSIVTFGHLAILSFYHFDISRQRVIWDPDMVP